MEGILDKPTGKRFLAKILTEEERAELEHRHRPADQAGRIRAAEFAAGRFAVKEAVSKAFGCGIGALLGFHDIRVTADGKGRPSCGISAEALRRLGLEGQAVSVHVSITHTGTLAGAFAVVERLPQEDGGMRP